MLRVWLLILRLTFLLIRCESGRGPIIGHKVRAGNTTYRGWC